MLGDLLERYRDWRARRSVFREMRKQDSENAPYEGQDLTRIFNRIKFAAYRGHAADALAAWNELRSRAPDLAITSTTALRALMELGEFAVVDDALVEAQKKYVGSRELAHLYAELAHRQGHWEEANRRWELVRKNFPGNGAGYSFGAIALGQLERYDEASELLEKRVRDAPDDVVAATEYARTAERQGNFEAAVERWKAMQASIHDVGAWIGEAGALMHLGREGEAIMALEGAKWRFESSPLPLVEITKIVQLRGDTEESLRQWAVVRTQFPYAPAGYIFAAWLLRDLGRLDEAEAILLRYVERDGGDSEPTVEYARFAHNRDWPEACRRWELVRDKFPERVEGYTWGADALDAVGQHEEAAAVRARQP